METYTIVVTPQELEALLKLIDSGVRHEGVAAAHAASVLSTRIQHAQPTPAPESEEDTNPDNEE